MITTNRFFTACLFCLAAVTGAHAQILAESSDPASGNPYVSSADGQVQDEHAVATEHLKNTISVWAGAWQSQIPDLYLSYYTMDYVGPGFNDRKSWLADRQAKVLEPKSIKIRLIDFELVEANESKATVRFTLIYQKPGYSDKTQKEMVLTRQNGMWRIAQENNLAVERL